MPQIFSLFFVILWSSAFITSKVIVENASPFASLSFRFVIVAIGFLIFSIYLGKKIIVNKKALTEACLSGILFHGFYLGGVFYSFSLGLSATIGALIVSLQPILTNLLAGPFLKEEVTWKQWIGILFGFLGTFFVIGYDFEQNIPLIALVSIIVALLAATTATLWQKKLSDKLPLAVSNFYQAIGASIFLFLIMLLVEDPYIDFNYQFVLSMSWQIIAISFGAFTILMYLIKIGTASKTSNLFFLIAPVSACMAWIFLKEDISKYDILGLLISSAGVYIATRSKKI
ncbi:MAG: hypothetical protein CFH19_00638 [Alphaproteobacteria bacterium MarineAlpha5_Bin9]|nr:MAG: hypothetical protein CFH19_00638 [Alphaproteobacteria bacterium MarineAlpha5_Bin9]|tara:strand:+ start:5464 stop:6321 length:858 start_codon:yes stop_codon:yes gene_type:complete